MSTFTSAGEYASADFIYGEDDLDRKLLAHLSAEELAAADQHAVRVLHNAQQFPDVYGHHKPRAEEIRAAIAEARS